MKPRIWHFWAIEAHLGHRDDLILGIHWFLDVERLPSVGLDGPSTALFRTREKARAAIKAKGLERYRTRAVPVTCTVRRVK